MKPMMFFAAVMGGVLPGVVFGVVTMAGRQPAGSPAESVAAAGPDWVVVRPRETPAVLPAVGAGWETFHHTRANDPNLPDWIPSTVAYARWGWRVFEPRPGAIDFAFLDREIRQAQQAGQQLAFRVMCCSSSPGRPYHPDWLEEVGGRVVSCRYGSVSGLKLPDLDDPVVLERHLDFIRRLGARYDGHPGIAHVDLGSVGWWGEWHMSRAEGLGMPKPETQRRIVETYLQAFRRTPLLMLIGGGDMLRYALEKGTGWRADCLGDLGGFSRNWCHMRHFYIPALEKADGLSAWKRAPVAFETCWDMRKWVNEGWPLRYIFNYALAMHASVLNNKSAPLPPGEEVRAELRRFLRRLGPRFVLERLAHPSAARPGALWPVQSFWRNVGSAPCYRPIRLAWRLTDAAGRRHLLPSRAEVRQWMPGEVDVTTPEFLENPPDLPPGPRVSVQDRLRLPADLASGPCRIEAGFIDPTTRRVLIRAAVEGPEQEGWVAVSRVEIR
ncbi:MAG: DUF4832 domain-containing protein [Verrucomicrobia bacterium]|nr:MAG: DUF4832 domain-containing protein [Verrucomicrobiota bacterium]